MIDHERIDELRREIGDEDFAEVLEMFMEEMESALAAFDTAGPPDRIAAELHALKGSALNLGLSDLAAICATAERTGADPNLKGRLDAAFAQAKSAISATFNGV